MENVPDRTTSQEAAVDLLHDVYRGLAEYMAAFFRDHGIPPSTLLVAARLRTQPGITISEIARQTGLAKSRVKAVIDEMAEGGMVLKEADPADRRIVRLSFAPAALAKAGDFRAALRGHLAKLLVGFSDAETARIALALAAVQRSLAATKEEPPV